MTKDFTHYNIEDFAADPDFILWVRGRETQQAWEKVAATSATLADKINKAKILVGQLTFEEAPNGQEEDLVWNRITNSLPEFQESTTKVVAIKKQRRSWLPFAAAAASIAAVITFWPQLAGYNLIKTTANQEITYLLPDRSAVTLNDASTLKVHERNWSTERHLSLKGQAFFEVEKGKKFIVETPHGSITVLGTSFSVLDRGPDFEVACKTGRVEVQTGGESTILEAGQAVSLQANSLQTSTEVTVQLEWMDGIYKYENTKLNHVFAEMQRQFDIKIQCDQDIEQQYFTGFFQDDNVKEALNRVLWPMKLSWKEDNGTIQVGADTSQ